ncbi:MAG: 6-bladed beta-propeller [Prevotellaceae bacterium]|jgi:hypothetical protein|nr:6-bladed beta-propeller [Prevotellaceae bacterium]
MKKITSTFCLYTAFLLFVSCQSLQTECPVIEIDNPAGSIDLNISDLLDNITIVPLETRDDLLLQTAGTTFTVTDHYILVKSSEKLLQFDRNGNYIRTLANRGSGPNEFNMVMTSLTDEKRQVFYYADAKANAPVACIDLNSGKFIAFPNPDLAPSSIREIDGEGNIYGYSSSSLISAGIVTSGIRVTGVSATLQKAPDSLALAYIYDPYDNRTTTLQGKHTFDADSRRPMLFRQGDFVSFLFFPYSDTLYRLDGGAMIPQYVLKLKNQMTDMQKGGITLDFTVSGNWGSIISLRDSKVTIIESGGTISSITVLRPLKAYLLIDRNRALHTIRSLTIDPIALTIDIVDYIKLTSEQRDNKIKIQPMPAVSGKWGHFNIEASDMTALINQALESNKLSAVQRKTLQEVAAKIDDDSNPVLIIGKIK